MMKITWFFVLIVMVSGQTTTHFSYPSVFAPKNTVTLDPRLPPNTKIPPVPVLPQQFQVRVEANMLDKKQTVVAEEFYDYVNGRAALHLFVNNTMKYIFFDYANNQIIFVVNGSCQVNNLRNDINNQLFFGAHSTQGTLNFAKANGLLYKGTKTIRGIDCDWWQSCMFWPILASNFTLDYYFSEYNWMSPDLSGQVPVLAELAGIVFNVNPHTYIPFHHKYEYFDFRHQIWGDGSVLQTPAGIACPGRLQTKKVPSLPEQFSYSEEIVSTNNLAVSQAMVYYDHIAKLAAYDYRPSFLQFPYYVQNTLVTEIHDYNTGIAYGIDTVRGNCTMFPLSNTSYGSSWSQSYLRMKLPNEIFYLDNTTYTYEGTRTVRGILCDVFISKRTDFKLPGYPEFSSTFEIYFLNKQWAEYNSDSVDVPIQLRITTPDWVGYGATYNIYDFTVGPPSEEKFSVASCYADTSMTAFRIAFPGNWDSSLMQYHNLLISTITDKIVNVSHVSPIRVQNRQLIVDSNVFYFIATLLDTPPPLAFFTKLPGHLMHFWSDKTRNVNSVTDCASYCNNPVTSPSCDSFIFCASRLTCAFSTSPIQGGALIHNFGTGCDHYVRTIQSQVSSLSLSEAMKMLKNDVITGNFQLNVNVSGQVTMITAGSVDDNILRNSHRTLSTKDLMDKFSMQTNKFVQGYADYIYAGFSIDDCASSCLNEMNFVCNSFWYDLNTAYCVVSRLHPDERPTLVVNRQLTDLYIKKYTVDYEMVPGTTVLSSSDIIYQNVNSADMCAKLCSVYDGFSCKSFDYCDDISTCYLGRTHFYDVPKADKRFLPICNHFSRKYLLDFKITKRRHLTNTDDRIISGVSVGQCAKLCVEEESNDCASFGYCGNITECRLSTASMRNIGQVSSKPSFWCDVYNRQTYPDGTPYTPKSSKCVSPLPSTATMIPGHSATPSPSKASSSVFAPGTETFSTPNAAPPSTSKYVTASGTSKSMRTSSSSTSMSASISSTSMPASSSSESMTQSSLPSSTTQDGNTLSSQNPYTKKPLKYANSSPSENKGLSAGGVVGVALGTLVAGILITAVAYFGIKKFKGRLPDEMHVRFAKQEVEIN